MRQNSPGGGWRLSTPMMKRLTPLRLDDQNVEDDKGREKGDDENYCKHASMALHSIEVSVVDVGGTKGMPTLDSNIGPWLSEPSRNGLI